ncbi:ankyrin repeat domain-containing protein [Dechloromonas sp. XY25]|uniref:Ankyrin repeat domain-containing protein n=1 Tax=Dechloromonas hankyongensis TaxID=2908002 RepID=A0ABS9K213_9RHOO|nr:ankyrin repeat domain-containing protein [Dechloromonas hankyongensis]MCG2577070.1 ankyrin repeat domain-containing protein [Dechloromonas hankyongensis]
MTAKAPSPNKLIAAIRTAQPGKVLAALAAGADVNEADMHGFAGLPLRTACFMGDLAVVRELLRHGANPDVAASDGPGAALRLALRCGHQDIAGLLLQHGASIPDGLAVDPELVPASRAQPEPSAPPAGKPADNLIEFTPSNFRCSAANDSEALDIFGTETNALSADLLFLEDDEVPAIDWKARPDSK